MAVDKNRVVADATKLVQKGQFDKAIRVYEKILSEDPKDVRVLLKIGELQQKKGDPSAAAETFGRVADAYSEQGFFLKAVAVLKQMLKLAPEDLRVNERLAGLYQQLGILSDAMAQLQIVAAAAERAGDEAKLGDVLRRMVELEPDNVASAVKLGELYAKQDNAKLALEHFRRAASQLKRNNRADEYVKVAERISFFAQDDLELIRELANIYLAKGDTKRALAKLQLCFKADPKNVETLTLLAQAFRDLGQTSKTISVYKELAHLHAEQQRADEARATWRRVLELAPDDPEALAALEPPRPAAAQSVPATLPRVAPPPPPMPVRAPPPGPPPGAQRPKPLPPPPAAPGKAGGPEVIPKLLTETDVYLKYGLHQKALEHLDRVFAIDPDHLEAREKALALKAERAVPGAADEAVRVARIALGRGLKERAAAAVARLRELAPDHPELADLAAHAAFEEEVVVEPGEDLLVEVEPTATQGGDEMAIAAARTSEEEVVVEEEAPPPPPLPKVEATPVPPPRPPSLEPPRTLEREVLAPPPPPRPLPAPPAESVHPIPAPPILVIPPPPPPGATAAPVRAVKGEVSPLAAAPAALVEPPAPPPKDLEEEEDLDDDMEEADFFIEQGLLAEAREALENLLAFYPNHKKLKEKLAELARRERPEPPAPPPPETPTESFDIARELAEELGASAAASGGPEDEFQYSVEDVFSQFKRGVAETVKPEDSETHYDLGIAYKEMGLLDDALHEFEVALAGKSRKKEVDCLTMVGLCHMEKGDAQGALEAYQRALRSDFLAPEAARALHYEMASAYEALGEKEVALHYLQRILRVDPKYRDAKARVEKLGGGPGRPPPNEPVRPAAAEAHSSKNGPKKNIGYL